MDRRTCQEPTNIFLPHVIGFAERHAGLTAGLRFAVGAPPGARSVVARLSELLGDSQRLSFTIRGFTTYEDAEAWLEEPRSTPDLK